MAGKWRQHVSCKAAYNPLIAPKVQLSTLKETPKGKFTENGSFGSTNVL